MLSRNLSARAVLKRSISQRFRNFGAVTSNNDNEEKLRLIQSFDNKKVDELLKRQKFALDINASDGSGAIDVPSIPECLLDTGFEDDCNYFGNLHLLGPFGLFENFETRNDGDIGGEIFSVSPFKYIETFEDDEILGDIFKIDSFLYVEDFENDLVDGGVWDMTQDPPESGTVG